MDDFMISLMEANDAAQMQEFRIIYSIIFIVTYALLAFSCRKSKPFYKNACIAVLLCLLPFFGAAIVNPELGFTAGRVSEFSVLASTIGYIFMIIGAFKTRKIVPFISLAVLPFVIMYIVVSP